MIPIASAAVFNKVLKDNDFQEYLLMQIITKLMSSTYLTFLFLTYPGYVHSIETNVHSRIYALFKISVLPYTSSQLYLNDGNQIKITWL